MLLVGEVKAINTGVLQGARPVLLDQFVDFDHALSCDTGLRQIDAFKSVFVSVSYENLLERLCEALAELHIIREVQALDEGVLKDAEAELVSG